MQWIVPLQSHEMTKQKIQPCLRLISAKKITKEKGLARAMIFSHLCSQRTLKSQATQWSQNVTLMDFNRGKKNVSFLDHCARVSLDLPGN